MDVAERIIGLKNLRKGYDATAAVGFWRAMYGEDLIDEYERLATALLDIAKLHPDAQYAGSNALHIANRALGR